MKKIIFFLFLFVSASQIISIAAIPSKITDSSTTNQNLNEAFQQSLAEFKSLSKSERRAKIKEAKTALKEYKKDKSKADTDTLLMVIIAILLPPLAVYLHQNEINSKFWLSLLLTLLFWLPGVIYALIVILNKD
ncbi:MAG: YqaE/Pmp3 family membrane protein [Chitinophagaceae bacterium]